MHVRSLVLFLALALWRARTFARTLALSFSASLYTRYLQSEHALSRFSVTLALFTLSFAFTLTISRSLPLLRMRLCLSLSLLLFAKVKVTFASNSVARESVVARVRARARGRILLFARATLLLSSFARATLLRDLLSPAFGPSFLPPRSLSRSGSCSLAFSRSQARSRALSLSHSCCRSWSCSRSALSLLLAHSFSRLSPLLSLWALSHSLACLLLRSLSLSILLSLFVISRK